MFAWDIAFWFCCLNPREREVLRLTIEGLILTVNVGIPVAAWDLFWVVFPDNGAAVRAAFLTTYRLSIVTIEVGDPPVPVDVVQADEYTSIISWALFLLEPEAACVEGCQQSTVP